MILLSKKLDQFYTFNGQNDLAEFFIFYDLWVLVI